MMLKVGDMIKTSGEKDLKATLSELGRLGYGAVTANYSGTWIRITSAPMETQEAE